MSTKTPSTKGRRPGAIYLEPDSLPVVLPAIAGALTVGAVSFLMSWDALRVVGTWAGIAPARTWGLPLSVDSSILVFSALWLIARRRGMRTWFHVLAVTLFTLGSVGGNVAHALAAGIGQGWQIAVGAVAAAAFPLTVFATTHAVAGLLVDPDADIRPARRPARRRVESAQPQPALAASPATSASVTASEAASGTQVAPAVARASRTGTTTGRADRAALRARAVELAGGGMSHRQIADELGIPAHTTIGRWVREAAAENADASAVPALFAAV